jgi:choline dehydrogenase-like flavoprotein
MFIDARDVEQGAKIVTDLCIVGAGAAGITLACHLKQSGLQICLLESGGLEFDPGTNSLYKGDNIGLPYFELDVCQLRAFGGNTNAWGGWCRPLDDIDFEPRPWVENSGWPLRRAELDHYYRQAHAVCQLPDECYTPEAWIAALDDAEAKTLALNPALLETSIYQFSPPTRFGRVYAEEIRRWQTIRCFLHANVVNIATTQNASEVTHVDVAALGGHRFTVSAKWFVLAAGGTENARLLLVSRDVMPTGLANERDLVGRFFMEHPHTRRRIIARNKRAPVMLYGLKFHNRGVAARLSLPPALQERERLLNYSANIHAIYKGHETAGWMALRKLVLSTTRSRRGDPYLRFRPYGKKQVDVRDLWRIARELPPVALAGFLQAIQPNMFIEGYVLESKSEQAPNPASRLKLKHERDALGLNRVQLDWRMLPIDRHTIIRAEEIVGGELERLGIGRLEAVTPELDTWPGSLEGGWHQLGMTRMDVDPRKGVTAENCQVHGIGNLFIAGGSVFPTVGAAPPTLTIVALALRLGDHLKENARTMASATILGPSPRPRLSRSSPASPELTH